MPVVMTPRERVYRALTFRGPDRSPRDLWMLGAIPLRHKEQLAELLAQYPLDFARAPVTYRKQAQSAAMQALEQDPHYATSPGGPRQPSPDFVGRYVDEWGCEWQTLEPGAVGEVIRPRLAGWSELSTFSPPIHCWKIDLGPSYPFYDRTDRCPLLQHRRGRSSASCSCGFENLMADIGLLKPNSWS